MNVLFSNNIFRVVELKSKFKLDHDICEDTEVKIIVLSGKVNLMMADKIVFLQTGEAICFSQFNDCSSFCSNKFHAICVIEKKEGLLSHGSKVLCKKIENTEKYIELLYLFRYEMTYSSHFVLQKLTSIVLSFILRDFQKDDLSQGVGVLN